MSEVAARRREGVPAEELEALAAIERRVLWLAVRIVDYANRERPPGDALKVGGHQASSASMVSLMTALYVADLRAEDRVSVKPHASPVLHALEYLLGRLPGSYLTTLRDLGGLQAYPSRTKDPYPVDYSTGSVGLGAAAPLFGALVDRYVGDHFGTAGGGRYISLLGDAELDEGNLWEAVLEPAARRLGNVLWLVDLNRQSLDRVVPIIKSAALQTQFDAAGWQVLELKYGRRLRAAFAREGGELLRRRIDEMPNQQYQGLFGASEDVLRSSLLSGLPAHDRRRLARLLDEHEGELAPLVQDLGGHDLGDVLDALAAARTEPERPTVVFAYTIKGFGLPIAGRPMNHSVLLTGEQVDDFRAAVGLTPETEWDAFDSDSPEGLLLRRAAERLVRPDPAPRSAIPVPASTGAKPSGSTTTQAALGRLLLDLSRVEGVAERLVTVSPDVAVSTNLGGWINKAGIYGGRDEPSGAGEEESTLRWRVSPAGRHIELGISEMNLFLLLGQLGLADRMLGEPLFAVGTLYDPFVVRGLEALVYSLYSGARFVVAGTPSGVSLSREGGAHQSIVTPGVGMELPGLVYAEPCYARELEWLLLDGVARLQEADGEALYLRLSTTPVEQRPFEELAERRGEEPLRADVLAGGFWLREVEPGDEAVVIATCGALVPEALAAADLLERDEGVAAGILVCSSPDRLYRRWRETRLTHLRDLAAERPLSHLERLVPPPLRRLPLVTAVDGASHSLAVLGACLGMETVPLGVDRFGQSGSQPDIYAEYELSAEAIAGAAVVALG
jgi:pyruvate dehydrogenase E1 component